MTANDVYFAVNIQFLEITEMEKYFKFELLLFTNETHKTEIPLRQC